eukprot:CAMPEP_0119319404 /NCGR_PEP_ID=MMETSP1333-20130426/49272_1 /TAXON_ID=418940 /ORGANISM="Scyphosphaera apsteinii, Strain RCC1455" /LENGTH=231 /DNA_ID=CAMNT_0007325801 /DNA_START=237 /DNA_END=932 /DNA_ORIENTATION=-
MCEELCLVLRELEVDPEVRGVVVGSAIPSIFSAGLDLKMLYGCSDDNAAAYWTAVQEFWMALYTTPLATVAAINGHCPAGGCLIALSCDSRVMVDGNFTMGMNEASLGLVAPMWVGDLLRDTVGVRKAEQMLMRGDLLSTRDALEIGMIDQMVPSISELHGASLGQLTQLLEIPESSRSLMKLQLRKLAADRLRESQSEDLDLFVKMITDSQPAIGAFLASLKKREKGDKG